MLSVAFCLLSGLLSPSFKGMQTMCSCAAYFSQHQVFLKQSRPNAHEHLFSYVSVALNGVLSWHWYDVLSWHWYGVLTALYTQTLPGRSGNVSKLIGYFISIRCTIALYISFNVDLSTEKKCDKMICHSSMFFFFRVLMLIFIQNSSEIQCTADE